MRTTLIGKWTPPNGCTPGMRRPVRVMTLPSISSRRIRLGEPTSSRPSGAVAAAAPRRHDGRRLDAEPAGAHGRGGVMDDPVLGQAAVLGRQVEALEVER